MFTGLFVFYPLTSQLNQHTYAFITKLQESNTFKATGRKLLRRKINRVIEK